MLVVRIGELAERTGVPTKTLRYWEQVGVIDPTDRTESGYRDYTADTVTLVGFVRAAQDAGFSLAEIATIVALRAEGQAPCVHVSELIDAHLADVEIRLRELRRLRTELRGLADRAAALDPADCGGDSICRIIVESQPAS